MNAATNEQHVLMKDSHGREITITLVSEDVAGDPPRARLLSATAFFDLAVASWCSKGVLRRD